MFWGHFEAILNMLEEDEANKEHSSTAANLQTMVALRSPPGQLQTDNFILC